VGGETRRPEPDTRTPELEHFSNTETYQMLKLGFDLQVVLLAGKRMERGDPYL
jgi:hypothetical protein